MTGGMLGLAGSTGIAGASSNGGSRKISINQMPSHNHTGTRMWTKNGGESQLAWGNAGFSLNFNSTLTTTSVGGGRTIFLPTPLSMVGDALLNLSGGEQCMAFINLLQVVYPVGSIYISTSDISPSSIIGGTWTKISGSVLAFYNNTTGYASGGSYGGTKKIATKHFPNSSVSFRTMALERNNMILGGDYAPTGIFSKTTQVWEGSHEAGSVEMYTPYNVETINIDGDNSDFIPYHFGVYGWYRTA